MLSFICTMVCNLILYCFIRRTVKEGERKALENESRLSAYNSTRSISLDGSGSVAMSSTYSGRKSILRSSEKQWKRVRDVGKQSFLYVSAYLLCYFWSLCKHYLDGQNFDEIEGSGTYLTTLRIYMAIIVATTYKPTAILSLKPATRTSPLLLGGTRSKQHDILPPRPVNQSVILSPSRWPSDHSTKPVSMATHSINGKPSLPLTRRGPTSSRTLLHMKKPASRPSPLPARPVSTKPTLSLLPAVSLSTSNTY